MKVLITEQSPGDAVAVAERLGSAGYTLNYCHNPNTRDSFCVGLEPGGECPLTGCDVSVVVDARSSSGVPTPREFGAVCAELHGTPLVVAGPVPERSAAPWRAADEFCTVDDVQAACDRAVAGLGRSAHREAARAARQVIAMFDGSERASVTLHELPRKTGIDAFVATDHHLPPLVRETVRAAIRATLARHTTDWQYAQVIFRVNDQD